MYNLAINQTVHELKTVYGLLVDYQKGKHNITRFVTLHILYLSQKNNNHSYIYNSSNAVLFKHKTILNSSVFLFMFYHCKNHIPVKLSQILPCLTSIFSKAHLCQGCWMWSNQYSFVYKLMPNNFNTTLKKIYINNFI